jgi:hypothetical protein
MTGHPQEAFLTTAELSARYGGKVAVRTFNNWRTNGGGPPFLKIGGRVLYRLSDVVAWEDARTARSTSEYPNRGLSEGRE